MEQKLFFSVSFWKFNGLFRERGGFMARKKERGICEMK